MFANRCRVAASALAPLSYICLVSGLVPFGAALNLVGQALITPFALKNRAWDMIALSVFFTAVNVIAIAPHVAEAAGSVSAAASHLEWVDPAVHAASSIESLHE